MPEDLIVVAANGPDYIDKCRQSLQGLPYLVIDTGSNQVPDAHIKMPFKSYSSGAYLWAYWHHPAHNYFFMQDSMVANSKDFLAGFKQLQTERSIVALASFGMCWDTDDQRAWAHYLYGPEEPEMGIWGPVFYTSRKILDELRDKQLMPPTSMNKDQAQGCERLWAIAFARAAIEVKFKDGDWHDGAKMFSEEQSPTFTKIFAGRK